MGTPLIKVSTELKIRIISSFGKLMVEESFKVPCNAYTIRDWMYCESGWWKGCKIKLSYGRKKYSKVLENDHCIFELRKLLNKFDE